nr:hypothetical protein [Candidatus Njordarchaeota archaeon]
MIRAATLIDNATDTLRGKVANSTVLDYISWATGNASAAQQLYQTMNYAEAVSGARAAQSNAIIAAQMAQQLPIQTLPDTTSTISFYQALIISLFGLTLFLVLVIYAMTRRKIGRTVRK